MSLTYFQTEGAAVTISDAGRLKLADEQRLQHVDPLFVWVKLGSLAGALMCIAVLVLVTICGG